MRIFLFFIALSVGLCLCAEPKGMQVQRGGATIKQSGSEIIITCNDKSVIHWDTFDIGEEEIVRFVLENEQSAVLNRITGGQFSQIDGALRANGAVFFLNESGIQIDKTASVQTAGFLATTGQIIDKQFLRAENLEISEFGEGEIAQLGAIECTHKDLFLVSKRILSSGKLSAPHGHVGIGVSAEVLIKPLHTQRIHTRSSHSEEGAADKGAILSCGNIHAVGVELRVGDSRDACAISQTGLIQATGTDQNHGKIVIVSDKGLVHIDGHITAPGGHVEISSAAQIQLLPAAYIDVAAAQAGTICIGQEQCPLIAIEKSACFDAHSSGLQDSGRVELIAKKHAFKGAMRLYEKNNGRLVMRSQLVENDINGQSIFENPAE